MQHLRVVRIQRFAHIIDGLNEVLDTGGARMTFENAVRWLQKHCVASSELQEPTRQPFDENESLAGS